MNTELKYASEMTIIHLRLINDARDETEKEIREQGRSPWSARQVAIHEGKRQKLGNSPLRGVSRPRKSRLNGAAALETEN